MKPLDGNFTVFALVPRWLLGGQTFVFEYLFGCWAARTSSSSTLLAARRPVLHLRLHLRLLGSQIFLIGYQVAEL